MNCLSIRRNLSAYRDGGLSKEARWHFRRHFKECDACRAEFEALEVFLGDLAAIEAPPAPDHLWDRIAASVDRPRAAVPAPAAPAARPFLAAAAGFLLMAGAIRATRPSDDPATFNLSPTREERVIDEIDYDIWYLDGRRVVHDQPPLADPSIEELVSESKEPRR